MVSTAFSSVKQKHFPAVVLAMFPYFANYIMTRFNGAAGEVVAKTSAGIVPLGQGAMFTGLIWGAILVFILENEYKKAAFASLAGTVLAATGFMHAAKLSFMENYQYPLGYLIMAIMFVVFEYAFKDKLEKDGKLETEAVLDFQD